MSLTLALTKVLLIFQHKHNTASIAQHSCGPPACVDNHRVIINLDWLKQRLIQSVKNGGREEKKYRSISCYLLSNRISSLLLQPSVSLDSIPSGKQIASRKILLSLSKNTFISVCLFHPSLCVQNGATPSQTLVHPPLRNSKPLTSLPVM